MQRPLRHLSLLAASAALVVAAFTGAIAVADTSVAGASGANTTGANTTGADDRSGVDDSTAGNRAPGAVDVTGNVAHRLHLSVAGLQALPSRTVEVTFESGSGTQRHVYTGPRLPPASPMSRSSTTSFTPCPA